MSLSTWRRKCAIATWRPAGVCFFSGREVGSDRSTKSAGRQDGERGHVARQFTAGSQRVWRGPESECVAGGRHVANRFWALPVVSDIAPGREVWRQARSRRPEKVSRRAVILNGQVVRWAPNVLHAGKQKCQWGAMAPSESSRVFRWRHSAQPERTCRDGIFRRFGVQCRSNQWGGARCPGQNTRVAGPTKLRGKMTWCGESPRSPGLDQSN